MKITNETIAHGRLSAAQINQFHNEGYLIYPEKIFADNKFRRLADHFEEKLKRWPADMRPEAMDAPHFDDPALFEWLLCDEALDLVEPLLGPNIALFSSHFICKPKGDGRRVPWHEDSAYWKGVIDPVKVVTVWLAIDPSTPENGCMYIIPRTHNTGRRGFSDYDEVDPRQNVFSTEIQKEQRDESRAVACILEPNHASLHDGRLMHGSPPNRSPLRRCGYTMRYMSTDCRLSDRAREWHQIYLARGKDLANQPYADPAKAYPELMKLRMELGKKGH